MRRFIAVRGPCELIRSDRGTNIIGAINQALDLANVSQALSDDIGKWELNPPHASHFGGAWERKIGQVKRCMDYSLMKVLPRSLSRDELYTLFQEAASIVNSTPLWEVSHDPNEPQPLSPKMLLNMKEPSCNAENFTEEDLLQYGKRRWRRVQYVADQFWSLWRKFHLQDLQLRQKWYNKECRLQAGDIVLLREKNAKRNTWPIARVTAMKISDDGLPRSATVTVARDYAGKIKKSSYERPISELVLLVKSCPVI
jgi:hypothetical protein